MAVETLSDYEGLFFPANIPTIHVREAIKKLKDSFETTGVWTREGALKYIDKIFGEKLI